MSPPTPSTSTKLAVCALALLAALAIGEYFARASLASPPEETQGLGVFDKTGRRLSRFDLRLGWRLPRDAAFEMVDYWVETSRYGTREPAFGDDDQGLKILCLGDSTVFGNHTSFPSQLRRLLRASDPEVAVMNAAIPGFSSYQCARFLETELADLRPDIVIQCAGMNDSQLARDGKTDRQRDAERARQDRWWYPRLVDQVFTAVDASDEGGVVPVERVPTEDLAANLERLTQTCSRTGAKLLLLTEAHAFPTAANLSAYDEFAANDRGDPVKPSDRTAMLRGQSLDARNDVVRAFAASDRGSNVALLDLARILASEDPVEVFNQPHPGVDSIHPNPLGFRLIAEHIADRLDGLGWLLRNVDRRDGRIARCSPPVAAVVEGEPRTRESLLLATNTGDRIEVRVVDPIREEVRALRCDLPLPTDAVDVAILPVLGDDLLITAPAASGFVARSVALDGSPGRLAPIRVPATAPIRLRITAVDLDGDGCPEYAASLGDVAPGRVYLLDRRLGLCEERRAGGQEAGVLIAAGRVLSPDREALLTWASTPPLATRVLAGWGAKPLAQPILHLRTQPTSLVAGHFDDGDLDTIVALRHCAVARFDRERQRWTEPFFPLGAARHESGVESPAVAAFSRTNGSDQAPAAIIASRTGPKVHLAIYTRDGGLERGPTVDLPDCP